RWPALKVPPNQTSVAHGDSAMSLDSRQTVLGPTSRPVVTAAGRGIDERRLPAPPPNGGHHPFWPGAGNGTAAPTPALAFSSVVVWKGGGKWGGGWLKGGHCWMGGGGLRNRGSSRDRTCN